MKDYLACDVCVLWGWMPVRKNDELCSRILTIHCGVRIVT